MSDNIPHAVPSATIMLLRDAPAFEVLMVQRHAQTRTHAGALVFPGGKTHAGDLDPRWAAHAEGWAALDDEQRGLRIAAVREAFEEAGILLARRGDGAPIGEAACALDVRKDVDAGRVAFLDVVAEMGAKLDLRQVAPFARWITPAVTAHRFDTWFFVARAPEDQLAACDGRETVDLEWVAPKEALRLQKAGERRVVFPTRTNLRLLAEASDAADAIARAAGRPFISVQPRIEERPEGRVLVLPPDAGYGPVVEPVASAG